MGPDECAGLELIVDEIYGWRLARLIPGIDNRHASENIARFSRLALPLLSGQIGAKARRFGRPNAAGNRLKR